MGQEHNTSQINNKLEEISKIYKKINNLYSTNISSTKVLIPRTVLNLLRSEEESNQRIIDGNDGKKSKNFDNLNDLVNLLQNKFLSIKNIFFDMEKTIDRNSIKIDELGESKNNKIMFSAYSKEFSNPSFSDPILKNTIPVTEHSEGIIANEDSGLEISNHLENGKNFIKLEIDGSKIDGINFVSDSSVKIKWNSALNAYELEQNDIFRYDSEEPEDEISIKHNLSTRALDVKVFKLNPDDIDLKYPIIPGMEYPSDNEIKIYLTRKELISVIISRI